MQSVELVLDDDSDRRVRRHWAKLADAGVPSQARHTGPANRPHITLAVTSDMSRSVQANIEVVLGRLPLPLTLGGLVVVGSGRLVLARLVVPSVGLLALQADVMAALEDDIDAHRHFAAGHWTPHVTLGRGLTAADVCAALTAAPEGAEIRGSAVRARRWDMMARVEHWFPVTGSDTQARRPPGW